MLLEWQYLENSEDLTIEMKLDLGINMQTTLQELQKQLLQLPISDRWQLVQTLLASLQRETHHTLKRGNLSRLRGIAKSTVNADEADSKNDYAAYLTEKYQ
jgi:hypothetical protein